MNFFTGNIIKAICWTLLHSLWQGLLLAVVTGVVMVLSKKSGSVLRYSLLSVIFIAFVVTVGATFYMQLHTTPTDTLAAPATPVKDVAPQVLKQDNMVFTPEQNGTANNMQLYINRFVAYFNEHASAIVTIWFIIFMARCVKILSGLVYIQRIRHYKTTEAPDFWKERITALANSLQIKRHIQLLQSAIITVPVVVGFLKPTILIPIGLINNLSQQEVESILIHELAHVRRKDYFFNLLQCFIDILFFFNPAVLWISSLIRNERENCCDDIAINETKSKKQFVQALVSFHQYNSNVAPAKYAMSFAARQNKLVNRVKRIVNNNNHTLNPVEKIVLLVCLLVFSVTFITVTNGQSTTPKKHKAASDSTAAASKAAGVNVKTNAQTNVKTSVKTTSETTTVKTETMTDEGNNENSTSAEGYIDGLQNLGYKNLTVDQLVYLKQHGVDGPFIKSFADAGYGKISLEKAVELRNHGISVDYIKGFKEAGFANITLDEAITARNHGVSPDYVKGFADAGYKNITLEEAENLRNQGVSADYIKSFADAGYKNITLNQAVSLRNQGVSAAYINELKQAGVKDLTLEKATEYRNQGVNADYLKSFHEAGFTSLTMDEALNLREHGVSADYIKELKDAGVKDLMLEKAVEYRDHGVNGNFIKSFHDAGFTNITMDKAMELRDHGVSVDYIRGMHNAGYPDVTPEEAMRLRDHGITPEYIAGIRSLGVTNLSLDKAIELRDHGITVEYVNSFAKIGIKNLSIDKAIQLRDHGVTADFIERIRKKTGNDFTLDEYIKLKEVF